MVGFASLENNDYLDLYVYKDHQSKGIANKLFMEIEAEAIKSGVANLYSDVSITARPFFEKNGFKISSLQRKIMDEILIINFKMAKKLA